MAKVNFLGCASKSVSLDALLGFLVMIIPVAMFFLTVNGDNPFVDGITSFVVLLMSVFLLVVMWINRSIRIPILEIFVLIYVLFWHLRFLTLTLFPAGELVLSRTVVVDHEIFNNYVWVVFISLIAAVGGIFIAHAITQHRSKESIEKERRSAENLSKTVKRNIRGIFTYCLIAFIYQIYVSTQMPEESFPVWLGYLSFFFPLSLNIFLVALVLFNKEVSGKHKLLFLAYMGAFIAFTVLMGTRSFLMLVVLSGLFISLILNINIRFRVGHFILILLLGLMTILSFAYGTYQRNMRDIYGTSANSESIQYVLERIGSMEAAETWEPMMAMASARAGYLDFSAEMFANPRYGDVVTIENILKSIIDGYIPGSVFEDSRQVALRIRDIYNPNAEGYQSDAIGAVGENYLLFGYAFPLVIAIVAFAFTYLYNAVGGNIYGIFIKFSVAFWLMTWWNSFGYDWLLWDIGRQLLFGVFVITLVFRFRVGVSHRFEIGKRG